MFVSDVMALVAKNKKGNEFQSHKKTFFVLPITAKSTECCLKAAKFEALEL